MPEILERPALEAAVDDSDYRLCSSLWPRFPSGAAQEKEPHNRAACITIELLLTLRRAPGPLPSKHRGANKVLVRAAGAVSTKDSGRYAYGDASDEN